MLIFQYTIWIPIHKIRVIVMYEICGYWNFHSLLYPLQTSSARNHDVHSNQLGLFPTTAKVFSPLALGLLLFWQWMEVHLFTCCDYFSQWRKEMGACSEVGLLSRAQLVEHDSSHHYHHHNHKRYQGDIKQRSTHGGVSSPQPSSLLP